MNNSEEKKRSEMPQRDREILQAQGDMPLNAQIGQLGAANQADVSQQIIDADNVSTFGAQSSAATLFSGRQPIRQWMPTGLKPTVQVSSIQQRDAAEQLDQSISIPSVSSIQVPNQNTNQDTKDSSVVSISSLKIRARPGMKRVVVPPPPTVKPEEVAKPVQKKAETDNGSDSDEKRQAALQQKFMERSKRQQKTNQTVDQVVEKVSDRPAEVQMPQQSSNQITDFAQDPNSWREGEQPKDSEYVTPHDYQMQIYNQIEDQWYCGRDPYGFGSIVFMPTGSGKTLVAIMLILRLFGLYNPRETAESRVRMMSSRDLDRKGRDAQNPSVRGKKVAFLVPTTNLVDQQAEAVNRLTDLKVGKFSGWHQKGGGRQTPGQAHYDSWRTQLSTFDVFVFTQKKLYDILMHGLMRLSEFDLVIFDECHHADQSHYYNLIMSDFFYYDLKLPQDLERLSTSESTSTASSSLRELAKQPFILGLTASPLKSKVGENTADITREIQGKLQTLSNNLYSRFVCISESHVAELERKQANVLLMKYKFDLSAKISQVNEIVDKVIKKLLKLIPLDSVAEGKTLVQSEDPSLVSQLTVQMMSVSEQIELLIESFTTKQAQQEQDEQVVKFLKKRHELISLDLDYVKASISLSDFPERDDKILLIFCIILLRNANNLILELGPPAFDRFVLDEKHLLLDRMSHDSKKMHKAHKILEQFLSSSQQAGQQNSSHQHVAQLTGDKGLSSKIQKLVMILNEHSTGEGPLPKVIVFVKDRVVAEYLHKLLTEMKELAKQPQHQSNSRLLDPAYNVAVAMSPKGKNLLNRAYHSIKSQKMNQLDEQLKTHHPLSLKHPQAFLDREADLERVMDMAALAGTSEDIKEFRSMLDSHGAYGNRQSSARISSSQLKDVLRKFRDGSINVLIATNVIEEGLDVSECNLVICLNELLNVKAFIQMKGRARKQDSKFVFLCADKELAEVEKERKNFGVVIEKMKELAFSDSSVGCIEPEVEKLRSEHCKFDETDFFEVPQTGARVSLRDAKSLVEMFCETAAEVYLPRENPEHGATQSNDQSDGAAAPRKFSKFVQELKPFYRSEETAADAQNKKYFLTALYMPRSCAQFLEDLRFMPVTGFSKKKDSENHVAQLALRKLFLNGYLDDYLYPRISNFTTGKTKSAKVSIPSSTFASALPQKANLGRKKEVNPSVDWSNAAASSQSGSCLRRRAAITAEEHDMQKKETVDFERTLKSSKSRITRIVEDKFRSLIKEKLDVYNSPKQRFRRYPDTLHVHCLRGVDKDNAFPFRGSRDFLGILYSRPFDRKNETKFSMCQEKKQKEKNLEYLQLLQKVELISDATYEDCQQSNDKIELLLSKENQLELDFAKLARDWGKTNADRVYMVQLFLHKLKFFHTWLFFYFYSADQKFIKNLLKSRFDFSYILFGEELHLLYSQPQYTSNLQRIHCPKLENDAERFHKKYVEPFLRSKERRCECEIYPFAVPLVQAKKTPVDCVGGTNGSASGLYINMTVINRVIDNLKGKLLEICHLQQQRSTLQHNLDLEQCCVSLQRQASFKLNVQELDQQAHGLIGIWDDRFTGVRYVKLQQHNSHARWDEPIMHLDNRASMQAAQASKESMINQSQYTTVVRNFEDITRQAPCTQRQIEVANKARRLDIFTAAKYNFDKYGLLLTLNESRKMFVVRKERHFVDFSKFPRQESNVVSGAGGAPEPANVADVSSRFDVVEQLLSRSPLTYEQYQTYQQACTQLLFFNEFLQVEKFIQEKFSSYKCYLQPKNFPSNLGAAKKLSKEEQEAAQLLSHRDSLQSDMEPSPAARNVFRDPAQEAHLTSKASDQLLNNIPLIMEALTAPNANRNYDYERLEFYGDSVISFLVILELFISKSYRYKEGPLDFYRIKKVSNMNFFKLNEVHGFYKYMINEPQTIFNDFVPGAFDQLRYQDRIKHKTLNELNNKVKYLRREKAILQSRLQQQSPDNLAFVTQARCYRNQYGFDANAKVSSVSEDKIYKKKKNAALQHQVHDEQILLELNEKLNVCIKKIEEQKLKRVEEIDQNAKKASNKKHQVGKQFFYKQLADVIESVTGVSMIACGLNLTQSYLRGIGVLDHSQSDLRIALKQLKHLKESNKESRGFVNWNYYHGSKKMADVEKTLGYTFRNKLWLVEALTHKSYVDQNQACSDSAAYWRNNEPECDDQIEEKSAEFKPQECNIQIDTEIDPYDDYERLEFLGDAILNFMIAEYFYCRTVNDDEKKMPKELHKMKTSVINNALLSLIVIENGIYAYVLYNERANAFKQQFDEYVARVHDLLRQQGSTKETQKPLDLDDLYEKALKILGDVFESLVGAVFIDSECMHTTWCVLHRLMEPYLDLYSNLQTLQDHSRTKLLELWNQKDFMKNFKCHHDTRALDESRDAINGVATTHASKSKPLFLVPGNQMQVNGQFSVFQGMVDSMCVLEVPYDKDAKNKVRNFYRHYYEMMSKFFEWFEKKKQMYVVSDRDRLVDLIHEFTANHYLVSK